jgi:hypothetical protein
MQEQPYKECGRGWNKLIDPLIKRCHELGGMILQIKEKYGGLRFYYSPMGVAPDGEWDKFEDAVDQAEAESHHICELCGKPGKTMVKAHWYKTICTKHSIELDYKETA